MTKNEKGILAKLVQELTKAREHNSLARKAWSIHDDFCQEWALAENSYEEMASQLAVQAKLVDHLDAKVERAAKEADKLGPEIDIAKIEQSITRLGDELDLTEAEQRLAEERTVGRPIFLTEITEAEKPEPRKDVQHYVATRA